jgi:valyl-tRNA synthetase
VRRGAVRIVPEEWRQTYFNWQEEYRDWCISRQLWWGHRIPVFYCDGAGGCGAVLALRTDETACPRCGGRLRQDDDVLDTWFSSALWPMTTLGWPDDTADLRKWYPTTVLETGHDILTFWVSRMLLFCLQLAPERPPRLSSPATTPTPTPSATPTPTPTPTPSATPTPSTTPTPTATSTPVPVPFMDQRVPFRTVYLHAMVRDEKGEKMSKSKGNVIDPLDVIDGASLDQLVAAVREQAAPDAQESAIAYRRERFPEGLPRCGADALRLTLAQLAAQGRDIKLPVDRLVASRSFCNKIWQAVRFARLNLGGFDPATQRFDPAAASVPDRWIVCALDRAAVRLHEALEGLEFAEAANGIYAFFWHELCDWYIEMAKPALAAAAEPRGRAQAQGALVLALDASLRLLHPFAPFVTEELWQALPRLPEHAGGTAGIASIMIAPFPRPGALPGAAYTGGHCEDPRDDVEWGKGMVNAVRTVRGEYNVPPSRKTEVVITGPDTARRTLETIGAYVAALSGSLVTWAAEAPRGALSQDFGVGEERWQAHVKLAGAIDVDAELARLDKELKKAEKELDGVRRKLGNADFVARAPAEIIEKERAKEREIGATLAARAQARDRIRALKAGS